MPVPSALVTPSAMQNMTAKGFNITVPESAVVQPVAHVGKGSLSKTPAVANDTAKRSPAQVMASPNGGAHNLGPVASDDKALESYRKPIIITIVTGEAF